VFYRLIRRMFLLAAGPMFRLRVEGRERLPRSGPGIVIAPHRSWLDPPCVGAACARPVRFLMLRDIYERPGTHWFYRRMGALPVQAGGSASMVSLRAAFRHLRQGELVGVFPEGRVVRGEALGELRAGAALLAVRSGAPVIPLAIRGTAEAWPHGRRLPRPGRVSVRIGEPIPVPPADRPGALEAMLESMRLALEESVNGTGAGERSS
jgi:1-acyl-sn-glycerol-3-phosphate acyltransferase